MPYIIVLVSQCKYMLLFLICNFRNEQGINIRGALEIESGVKVSKFVIGIGSIDTTQGIVQTHALLLSKQSDHVLGQFFYYIYYITFTSHNTVRYLRAFSYQCPSSVMAEFSHILYYIVKRKGMLHIIVAQQEIDAFVSVKVLVRLSSGKIETLGKVADDCNNVVQNVVLFV